MSLSSVFKCNATFTKIQLKLFLELDKMIINFIWKNNSQENPEKKTSNGTGRRGVGAGV